MNTHAAITGRGYRWVQMLACAVVIAFAARAAEELQRRYDLPAGDAAAMLRQFAEISGREILFAAEVVRGIRTSPVKGEFTAQEALQRLLIGTNLHAIPDERSGAIAVRRIPASKAARPSPDPPPAPKKIDQSQLSESPPVKTPSPFVSAKSQNALSSLMGWLLTATAFGAQPAPLSTKEEAITLSPFEVVDARQDGYGANRSSSVTLLNQDLAKLPVTSEIMTEAFMRDLNLNGDMSAMVENFGMSAGFASNQGPDSAFGSEPGSRGSNTEIKLRGLGTGGIRRDGMIALTGTSSADAFSTERVEILRGPNALLYQDAGGGGVITAVSKQARFEQRPSLSFSFRADSFGSVRGEADFNQSFRTGRAWLPRVAVRGAGFLGETRYWRDNILRKSGGAYLQFAFQLPKSIFRAWYENTFEDNYSGITPSFGYNAPRVGAGWVPPPEVIARHIGYNRVTPTLGLRDLLGETTSDGRNAAASILHGQLNWRNVSTWLVQKEWAPRAELVGSSLETRWSPTFSTLLKYMYREERRDMDINRSATLYPAGYQLTDINGKAYTTSDWTAVSAAPTLNGVAQRFHSFRAAGALDWTMWSGRVRSTVVPGVDYASSFEHQWYVSYYEADSSWNLLRTSSAQDLYRLPMAGNISFNAAIPVRYFRPDSDTERFTYAGRNWLAQEVSPEFYVTPTPNNPWGLPTDAITTNRGNWGRYLKWYRGAFVTMNNEWFDDRFTSMFSLRSDRSFLRQFKANQLDALEIRTDNLSYNTGLTARVAAGWRAFYNYSVAQNPARNPFPDPLGRPLQDARNTGVEYGFKGSLLGERVHLSVSRFTADAKNEFLNLAIGGIVNPSGLNGNVSGRGTWSNIDRKSDGYELSVDGTLARGWMMRLTAGMQQGRTGTDLSYPIYYNDEFHADSRGGVTWSDGTPYLVKVNPGDNSPNAPTQQLTVAMLNNGDANGNYRAILNPVNGSITNRGDVFPVTTDRTHGNVGTGRTGLPASANQLQWEDPLGYEGMYIASRAGMRSLGVPRYTVSLTNSYSFTSGWLKGVRVGGLISLRLDQANQVVRWPIETFVINKAGTLGVKKSTDNALASDMPRVNLPGRWIYTDRGLIYGKPDQVNTTAWISYTWRFRRVTWSTQINVNNLLNDFRVLPQPFNGTLYGETRGRYYTAEPRSWVWRNDFRF